MVPLCFYVKDIFNGDKHLLPYFHGRFFGDPIFLSGVFKIGSFLVFALPHLMFHKGYASKRHVMNFGANEQRMLQLAEITLLSYPIIYPKSGLVPALMKQLKVTLRFSQSLREIFELQAPNYTILLTNNIIKELFASHQKINIKQLRVVYLVIDLYRIQDGSVKAGAFLFVCKPQNSFPQDPYFGQSSLLVGDEFVGRNNLKLNFGHCQSLGLRLQHEKEGKGGAKFLRTVLQKLFFHL